VSKRNKISDIAFKKYFTCPFALPVDHVIKGKFFQVTNFFPAGKSMTRHHYDYRIASKYGKNVEGIWKK
jgi:hypothetical protein